MMKNKFDLINYVIIVIFVFFFWCVFILGILVIDDGVKV